METIVKRKIVVGYPDEVISTLTDLIQEGEVNVVLFSEYQEMFSPDVLEEKLSQSFNLNTGWETEPFSWGVEKDGIKFNKVGSVKIKDKDVRKYLRENGYYVQYYFPNVEDCEISDCSYEFVSNTLPDLVDEGLTKEDILWEEHVWEYVDRMVEEYLDEDVQELFNSYREREDWTLMDYTYGVMYEYLESGYDEYVRFKSECITN